MVISGLPCATQVATVPATTANDNQAAIFSKPGALRLVAHVAHEAARERDALADLAVDHALATLELVARERDLERQLDLHARALHLQREGRGERAGDAAHREVAAHRAGGDEHAA